MTKKQKKPNTNGVKGLIGGHILLAFPRMNLAAAPRFLGRKVFYGIVK